MSEDFTNDSDYGTPSVGKATIGSSIVIKGEISGSEDLVIEGTLEGSVNLGENTVTVGGTAKVAANITARKIRVQGEVCGDLFGKEVVFVESTGKVLGNITSPRLSLEEGARLKGAIDTDPSGSGERVAVSVPVRKQNASQQAQSNGATTAAQQPVNGLNGDQPQQEKSL
ncbi:MAG: polymer-forming cytoskeletal protein [Bdellovibrionales bacterium]|nr:polymer-forming cytoskeletal protein [Bdellovibrionales bacterium]